MAITTYAELKTGVANWLEDDALTSRIPEFIALAEDRIGNLLRIRAMEAFAPMVMKKAVNVTTVGGTGDVITLTPDDAAASYSTGDTYSFEVASNNTGAVTVDVSSLGAKDVKKFTEGALGDLEAGDLIDGLQVFIYYDGTRFHLIERGQVPLPSRYLEMRRVYLDGEPPKKLRQLSPQNFRDRYLSTDVSLPQAYTAEGDYLTFGPATDSTRHGRILYYRKFAAFSADADTNWLLVNGRGLYLYGALIEAEPFLENDSRLVTWANLWQQALDDLHTAYRKERYSGMMPEAMSEYTADR